MDIHEFSKTLGDALAKLDEVKGADERAETARRRLEAYNREIDALSEARAKMKEESDAHLAGNLSKLNAETTKHNLEVTELQKQISALQLMHKTQQENASNTLTDLNTRIGVARKELDAVMIEKEKTKGHMLDFAKQFM